jgi:uncharacterized membrane protein
MLLWGLAFGILYWVFMLSSDHFPKSYWLVSVALLLFAAAGVWHGIRDKKARVEYLKHHPSVADRVKSHIKPQASN